MNQNTQKNLCRDLTAFSPVRETWKGDADRRKIYELLISLKDAEVLILFSPTCNKGVQCIAPVPCIPYCQETI